MVNNFGTDVKLGPTFSCSRKRLTRVEIRGICPYMPL